MHLFLKIKSPGSAGSERGACSNNCKMVLYNKQKSSHFRGTSQFDRIGFQSRRATHNSGTPYPGHRGLAASPAPCPCPTSLPHVPDPCPCPTSLPQVPALQMSTARADHCNVTWRWGAQNLTCRAMQYHACRAVPCHAAGTQAWQGSGCRAGGASGGDSLGLQRSS